MPKISVENAHLRFPDFSGQGRFSDGKPNFGLNIDNEELYRLLEESGANIKPGAVMEDGSQYDPYIASVKINMDSKFPPKVVIVNGNVDTEGNEYARVLETEEDLKILDHIQISNYDLVVNTRNYSVNGSEGVSLYLAQLWVTQGRNQFEEKYAKYLNDLT